MKRSRPGIHHSFVTAGVFAALLGMALPVRVVAEPLSPVTVRTFNYARLPDEHLSQARLTVDVIFKTAGISIRWIDCRVPQSESGAACTDTLGRRADLLLRLTDAAPLENEARIVPLGTSMLDREQRTGVLMTVDVSSIRTIAGKASMDMTTLLGRAIAHEMGHLLLGSPQHAKSGLMRAFWSHDELRGARPSHWEFSPRQADRIRRALQTTQTAN